ncbi:MAG TPA: toxic anion resistance protein, partial [Thauera sp.]|nr:toxic anion resistance protein [Thauera sp.]
MSLSLPPIEDIAREAVPPQPAEAPEDAQLAATADAFVRDVLAVDEAELQRQREAVDTMGVELQRQAAWRSEMLQAPIRKL